MASSRQLKAINRFYKAELHFHSPIHSSTICMILQIKQWMEMILSAHLSLWVVIRFDRCEPDTRSPAASGKMAKQPVCKGRVNKKALSKVHRNGFLLLGCALYNILSVKASFQKGQDRLVNHQLWKSVGLLGGHLYGIVDAFYQSACEQ